MRQMIAGNWKMNLNGDEARTLAAAVGKGAVLSHADVVLCPPFTYLNLVGEALRGSNVGLGAQNCYCETAGAYTGEISPPMLIDVGCQFVILGHSERRQYFGDNDELVNRKLKSVLGVGLTAIVCVGETLSEREQGQTQSVVSKQLAGALGGVSEADLRHIVLAYEPVWAIGTGRNATPEQAQEVHADLRKQLSERYNPNAAATVRILYGGSVKPDNAVALLSQPDIDGALVGGASLKASDFMAIVGAARQP